MISESDVREKMAAVLANRLSIVEFARWIMSNSWNMRADSSASAVSLASEIHALLAERDDFSLSDSDFIHELRTLYDNAVISVSVDVDEFTIKVSETELFSPATQSETRTVTIRSPQTTYVQRPISRSPRFRSIVPVEL